MTTTTTCMARHVGACSGGCAHHRPCIDISYPRPPFQLGGTRPAGGPEDEETAAIAAASRAAAFAGVEDGTAAPSVPGAADGTVPADGAVDGDDEDDDGGFQIVLDSPDRGGSAASDLDGDDDFHIVLDAQTGSGNPYIPTASGPPRYNAPGGAPAAGGARANQYVREGAAPLAPRPALPKPDWGTDAAALTALLESKPLPLGPAASKGMPREEFGGGGGGGGIIPPPRPPTGPPPGPMSQRPSGMHLVTAPVGPGGYHHPAGIPRNAGEGGGGHEGGQYGSILPGRSTPPRHVGPNDDGSWATYDGKPPLARWNEEGQRILPGMGGGTRFIPPEEYKEFLALGHGGIFDVDLDHIDCAPWRHAGTEPSDFFNYGMNETSWRAYAQQVRHVRMEAAHRSRIATFDSAQLQQQQQQQPQPPMPAPQQQQLGTTPYAAYQAQQQQQQQQQYRGPPMGRPPPGMQPPPGQRRGRGRSASPAQDDLDGEDGGRGGGGPHGGSGWDAGPPGGGYRDGGRGGGGGYDPRAGGYPPPWAFGPPPGGGMGPPPWTMPPGGQGRPPGAPRGRERDGGRERERERPPKAEPAPVSAGPRLAWVPPPGVKRERSRSRERDNRKDADGDGKRRRR